MKTITNSLRNSTLILVIFISNGSLYAQLTTPAPATLSSNIPSGHLYATPLNAKAYLGFDLGVAMQQQVTLTDAYGDSEKISFDNGFRMDVQMGANFAKHWAAELELGFIANGVKSSYVLGTEYSSVTLLQLPILLNVIYTQPLGRGWSMYVGVGGGGVFNQFVNSYGYSTENGSAFAYQGQAGLRYAFSEHWEVGLAYKVLGSTDYDIGYGVSSSGNLSQSVLLAFVARF